MNVSGPFKNPARRDSRKPWYLSYFVPKLGTDGTPIVIDGKPVTKRKRPHYESEDKAKADIDRILAQYASAGAGSFVHSREAQAEYEAAKKYLPPGESLVEAAKYFAKHHPRADLVLIEEARERFLAHVKPLTEKNNYNTLKWRTAHFVAAFKARVPASIQRTEIMDYLKALPFEPRGILNQKRAVSRAIKRAAQIAGGNESKYVKTLIARDLDGSATSSASPEKLIVELAAKYQPALSERIAQSLAKSEAATGKPTDGRIVLARFLDAYARALEDSEFKPEQSFALVNERQLAAWQSFSDERMQALAERLAAIQSGTPQPVRGVKKSLPPSGRSLARDAVKGAKLGDSSKKSNAS